MKRRRVESVQGETVLGSTKKVRIEDPFPLFDLPDELISTVLSGLEFPELLVCRLVNSKLMSMISSSVLKILLKLIACTEVSPTEEKLLPFCVEPLVYDEEQDEEVEDEDEEMKEDEELESIRAELAALVADDEKQHTSSHPSHSTGREDTMVTKKDYLALRFMLEGDILHNYTQTIKKDEGEGEEEEDSSSPERAYEEVKGDNILQSIADKAAALIHQHRISQLSYWEEAEHWDSSTEALRLARSIIRVRYYSGREQGEELADHICYFTLRVTPNATLTADLEVLFKYSTQYNERDELQEHFLKIEASTASSALAEILGFEVDTPYIICQRSYYDGTLSCVHLFKQFPDLLHLNDWPSEKLMNFFALCAGCTVGVIQCAADEVDDEDNEWQEEPPVPNYDRKMPDEIAIPEDIENCMAKATQKELQMILSLVNRLQCHLRRTDIVMQSIHASNINSRGLAILLQHLSILEGERCRYSSGGGDVQMAEGKCCLKIPSGGLLMMNMHYKRTVYLDPTWEFELHASAKDLHNHDTTEFLPLYPESSLIASLNERSMGYCDDRVVKLFGLEEQVLSSKGFVSFFLLCLSAGVPLYSSSFQDHDTVLKVTSLSPDLPSDE